MTCYNCGTANSDTDDRCVHCGAALGAASVITMEPPITDELEKPAQGPLDDEPGLGAEPGWPTPPEGEAEAEKSKPKSKGPWKILLIAVAVLIALILGANAALLHVAPDQGVGFACRNTLADLEKRFESSPYQCLMLLYDCAMDGKVDAGFSYAGDIAASGTVAYAGKYADRACELAADLNIGGTPLKLDALLNKQRLAVQTSLLDDQYYGITYDSFDSDIEKFAELIALDDQTVAMLKNYMKYLNRSYNTDYTGAYDKYEDALREFFKSLDTQTGTETVQLGDEAIKCQKVTYLITKEDLIGLANRYYDLLAADETVKEAMISSFEMQADFGASSGDPEQLYSDMLTQIKNGIGEMEQSYSGDMAISFYIRNYKLLQAGFHAASQWEGETVNAELLVNFGKDPEKDDIKASMSLTNNDQTPVKGEFVFHSTQSDNHYESTVNVVYGDSYGNGEAAAKVDWDKASGALIVASGDGTWDMNGNLNIQEDRFTLALEDVLDDIGGGGDLDLSLSATPGANIPDPAYVNLDKWDQAFLDMVGSALTESGMMY